MTAPTCQICRFFFAPDDCPHVTHESPGIGPVCAECSRHAIAAYTVLSITPGIAAHPLPDHARRNSRKRKANK